jgi:hypothetical protein
MRIPFVATFGGTCGGGGTIGADSARTWSFQVGASPQKADNETIFRKQRSNSRPRGREKSSVHKLAALTDTITYDLVRTADPTAMSLKRYEYKIIDPALWRSENATADIAKIEEQLNHLGRQGWEILGFVPGDGQGTGGPLCLAKRKVKVHHRKHDDHEH